MPEAGATYYDRQEVRNAFERERSVFHALPGLIRHAIDNVACLGELLRGVDPDSVTSREALAALPVTRKSGLIERQQADLPFGGLTATPTGRLSHIFASPGPIYDPEGARSDYWRFARALFAAGVRAGELVHNTFSYHLTPAGFMVDQGARALGCPVIPGGTGQTDMQIRVMQDLRPQVYAGTPSFLAILLDRAQELGMSMSSLKKALVAGEAFPAALKSRFAGAGIDAFECYATADVGLIAYETTARSGLIVDESLIVEIVRPGTGELVAPGEVGEILVTAFNPDYPLIRFATGDLTTLLQGESPCGRTNMRIKGWMGRADQTTKVRGMFVHPAQVADIIKRHTQVTRARLVVERATGQDSMLLQCEVAGAPESLTAGLADSVRSITGLRAEVQLVAPGSLPNDGKVIDDRRPAA